MYPALFQKTKMLALTLHFYGLSLGRGLLHWCLSSISNCISSLRGKLNLLQIWNLLCLVPHCEATPSLKNFKLIGGFPPVGAKMFQNGSWSSWSGGTISVAYLPLPKARLSSGHELLLSQNVDTELFFFLVIWILLIRCLEILSQRSANLASHLFL